MPEPVSGERPIVSVDVEDWAQSSWDRDLPISTRAATNARRLLELLARHNVRATMFVLGKMADAFPDLVREIHAAGHEVACHGWGHVEIFKQSRSAFVEDIRRAKDGLEQIIGVPVKGYRAPDFSVVRGTLWALEALAESGFEYDSSIFPVARSRYGIPDWPTRARRVKTPGGLFIAELPIGSLRRFGRNWPIGGGGYHRLLPGRVARLAARLALQEGLFVFYCHPYELDSGELWDWTLPIPFWLRLHQGLGRGRFEWRLAQFLGAFGGQRMDEYLARGPLEELDLVAFHRA
jgi:polysaccharide deacetylase family protein (PEP-CTERM system associated)